MSDKPAESSPSVTRSKTMQLWATGPERYRLTGNLTDISLNGDYGEPPSDPGRPAKQVIHDFVVEGELHGRDLVIAELHVHANTHPYRGCPAVIPSCQALVGTSLTGGWRRTVLDTLGAAAGCTHITTLLLGLAEARTMAFFLQMNAIESYSEQTRADGRWTATGFDVAPSIVDACHVLTRSGPVIQKAKNVTGSALENEFIDPSTGSS